MSGAEERPVVVAECEAMPWLRALVVNAPVAMKILARRARVLDSALGASFDGARVCPKPVHVEPTLDDLLDADIPPCRLAIKVAVDIRDEDEFHNDLLTLLSHDASAASGPESEPTICGGILSTPVRHGAEHAHHAAGDRAITPKHCCELAMCVIDRNHYVTIDILRGVCHYLVRWRAAWRSDGGNLSARR